MRIPHSNELEQLCLGSMLSSFNAFNTGVDELSEDDFFFLGNRIIFQTLRTFHDKNQAVDSYLIAERLKDEPEIKKGYVEGLGDLGANSFEFESYAAGLKRLTTLRSLQDKAREILELVAESPEDETEAVLRAAGLINNISVSKSGSGITAQQVADGKGELPRLSDVYRQRIAEARERRESGRDFLGLSTGMRDLDIAINGLKGPDLVVIGARPSMGKTAFAMNIVSAAARQVPVLIFSLEMDHQQLVDRLAARDLDLHYGAITTGIMDPADEKRLLEECENIRNMQLIIEDQPSLTMAEIISRTRRYKESHDIQLMIVDHLGLVKGSKRAETRQLEVASMSRDLKMLAKELDIPVICVSQLNRATEKENRLPRLSDLRESGAIEQDADVVMFLHRWDKADPLNHPNKLGVILDKNRHGECKTIIMKHKLAKMQIMCMDKTLDEEVLQAFGDFIPDD